MFKKVKIRIRLIIYISVLLVLTMSTISFIIFSTTKTELQQRLTEKLQVINDLKIERIKSHFDNVKKSINHIEYNSDLDSYYLSIMNLDSPVDSLKSSAEQAQSRLLEEFESLEKTFSFNRIMLKSLEGSNIISTKEIKSLEYNDSLLYKTNSNIFLNAQKGFVYSDIYHPKGKEDQFYITVMAPYFKSNDKKEPMVIICCEILMNPVYSGISDTTGLGQTGETIITNRVGNKVHFISRPRDYIGDFLKIQFDLSADNNKDLRVSQLSVSNKNEKHGIGFELKDYKDNIVDAAWAYIPEINWGVITKIDHKESFTSIQYLRGIIVLLCSGILFFSVIIITIFVERFLTPIINIRNNLVSLAHGQFPKNLDYDMSDEIKDTTTALNNLVERLKNSTDFAKRIGSGDLNAKFHGDQTQDVLSKSLLSMQESLKNIDEENDRRKWATEGLAIHGELFRRNNSNLKNLGKSFIQSLIQYVNGVHGAIYAVSHVSSGSGVILLDEDSIFFELIGTYAYDIKEDSKKRYRLGQSIVGQCAKEKRTVKIENSPENFTSISSGLGKANATHIVCVPMLVNKQVMGVVELSNFTAFPDYVIEFIEMLGEGFASAVLSVQSSFQTQDTLKEFENTTSELLQKDEDLTIRYKNALTEIKVLKTKLNMLERNQEPQN